MFFNKRVFQNALFVVLIGLFAFPQVINLFRGSKDVVTTVGDVKVKYKDLIEFGGHDEKSFRVALGQMMSIAYVQNAFQDIGLAVSDQAVENSIKALFTGEDGKTDPEKIKDYLKKTNMSQAGLVKIVKDSLRHKQLFFACSSDFIKLPSDFITMYHRGLNKIRSGYYMNIDVSSLSEKKMFKYANLSNSDMVDLALEIPKIASKECYIFYVDKSEMPTGMNLSAMMKKYRFEQCAIVDGKIVGKNLEFNAKELSRNTLTTPVKVDADNAQYFVYYNPVGPDFMKNLPYESKFHAFVARRIAQQIKDSINSENASYYKFEGIGFTRAENISFAKNFQYKRCSECIKKTKKCDVCRVNDCVCVQHMNPDSTYTREVLVMTLLGKLGQVYFANPNPQRLVVCIPTTEELLDRVDYATVERVLNQEAVETCQKCAFRDLQESSVSIV